MGTRADFYVGRGKDAEWIGSIAWDGYQSGIDADVLQATSEADYRTAVTGFFYGREDVTRPEQGWPWPWDNSHTSDCAYAFDGDKVWHALGSRWHAADVPETDEMWEDETAPPCEFPDMSGRKNVTMGPRSGVIVVTA